MLPQALVAMSAIIIFTLGSIHLLYTFRGPKLQPRDHGLLDAMNEVAPVISAQTTMWKAWTGFNASHSMGAMLFGLVYGYLAMIAPEVLFESIYLTLVGLAMLAGLFVLGRRYWFSIPFTGIAVSLVLYAGGIAAWWLRNSASSI